MGNSSPLPPCGITVVILTLTLTPTVPQNLSLTQTLTLTLSPTLMLSLTDSQNLTLTLTPTLTNLDADS